MPNHPVIGILGGGQLGRMLQEQAALLGVELAVLDDESCPARQIKQSSRHVTGSFKDPDAVRELARRSDVLTVEIEHVNTEVLEEIATVGVSIGGHRRKKVACHPSWETLRLIQDKFLQKDHLAARGMPVAEQLAVGGGGDLSLARAGGALGYPFMLKARNGSYDGRGNFRVDGPEALAEAEDAMRGLDLYAERYLPFEDELAVMVVRTEDGEGRLRGVHAYPAVETLHEDSICTSVYYPPRRAGPEICERAKKLACDVVRTLKGRGVFAVEMFRLKDDRLFINEVAPRPHNSGHFTIEAVPGMSQYRAQLCSILDILPPTIKLQPRVAGAIMLNILGGATEDSHAKLVELTHSSLSDDFDVFLHLYGKSSKPGRKIGHITATSYSPATNLEAGVAPLIEEAARIRQERLYASSSQLRPGDAAAAATPLPAGGPSSSSSRDAKNPLVVVTMGSDSDLGVLRGAFEVLERFRVPYDLTITSAHRTPHLMSELARGAAGRGVRVLIAAAGGAAALPGMVASETPLPVIGVPVRATHLDGKDSLLSIVQMPRGCPVATVGINNSTNAGLLAVRILGVADERYRRVMEAYMKDMSDEVEGKAARLGEIGWKAYLDGAE